MKYEYYGYTVELPINLYLDGTDEDIENYCISFISQIDESSPDCMDFNQDNENINFHEFD